jgi:hypothetical protein
VNGEVKDSRKHPSILPYICCAYKGYGFTNIKIGELRIILCVHSGGGLEQFNQNSVSFLVLLIKQQSPFFKKQSQLRSCRDFQLNLKDQPKFLRKKCKVDPS